MLEQIGIPAARVRLTWFGGDPEPTDGVYSTTARFEEDVDWPSGETWSVVLAFDRGNVSAYFLSAEAPHHRLRAGRQFEMYEGTRRTALVEVLA